MFFALLKKRNVIIAVALTVCLFCLLFLNYGFNSYAVFFNQSPRKLPVYYVKTDQKKLAISFDCAWGTDYTDSLLKTMREKNVKCTFFTVEFWAKKNSDYLKKINEEGHEIGTHSSTHPHMSKLSKQAIVKELESSCSVIEQIIGKRPQVFRPPYGEYNDCLIETATELNLYTVQWDVDSLDWKNLSAKEITSRVLKKVKNGSIVLFHNQGLHTWEALPNIIDALKEKGYSFVTVGELIYKDNYYIDTDGGQIRNS